MPIFARACTGGRKLCDYHGPVNTAQRLWPKLRACAGPAGNFETIAARVESARESADFAASLARDTRLPRYEHALDDTRGHAYVYASEIHTLEPEIAARLEAEAPAEMALRIFRNFPIGCMALTDPRKHVLTHDDAASAIVELRNASTGPLALGHFQTAAPLLALGRNSHVLATCIEPVRTDAGERVARALAETTLYHPLEGFAEQVRVSWSRDGAWHYRMLVLGAGCHPERDTDRLNNRLSPWMWLALEAGELAELGVRVTGGRRLRALLRASDYFSGGAARTKAETVLANPALGPTSSSIERRLEASLTSGARGDD